MPQRSKQPNIMKCDYFERFK